MLAAGRVVVSNIQAPFAGYMNDKVKDSEFIKNFVGSIRSAARSKQSQEAVRWYVDKKNISRVMEVIK
jgi:hypothetical protein